MYNIKQEGMISKREKLPLILYMVFMMYVW